jgi:hypothetical protein
MDAQSLLSALLTPGTPQLTAILVGMMLYLAFVMLRRPAPAEATASAARAAASGFKKSHTVMKRPLGSTSAAVAAHEAFTKRPTVSICCEALFPEDVERAISHGVTIAADVVEVMREASHVSKVYLLLHDTSSEGLLQAVVQSALEEAGVLGGAPPSIPRHRFLCCDTRVGKVAIVRQLEAALHVESDREVHGELTRFGVSQWLITSAAGRGSFLDAVAKAS